MPSSTMASKRKADDFIYTLSDNDDIPTEEVIESNPPRKKSKKAKKTAQPDADVDEDGIWGKKEEDDGAMDSDFEFVDDKTTDFRTEDFEGWGFEGAHKAMNGAGAGQKKVVDVDEIVRRRRGDTSKPVEVEPEIESDEDVDDDDIDLDDGDDEVLAENGFGMGVASDDDESGDESANEYGEEEGRDAEGDDDAASDNDSIATPVIHPDDMDQSDATSDEEEDPEEAAKREAFFAPEEDTPAKQSGKSSFQNMSLSRPILRGLNAVGFNTPTPIQAKTIPLALEGRDLVGGAVTGSGKTAAFVVPILERLLYRPNKIPTSRVVIMAPTRELAIQCHSVATKLASHTDIKFCLAVGGLSLKVQEAELRLRPDVIIATPGRFIDHMRNSASFATDSIEILVLDEADRMLEDGFADELNEILTTLPKSRQTMLFSATMTSSVDRLIRVGMNRPVRVMVDSQKKVVDKLEQKFVRLRPGREEKRMGYLIHICKTMHTERVVIFFRQKRDAHRARIIFALFNLTCAELHGSMNQTQRITSVESFRDGKVNFLLATDLASRGLDIKGIDTVINYEGPQTLEIYVHRVGRTARAGRSGVAITLAAEPDRKVVKAVVKAGKSQGAKISSLLIEAKDADEWQARIDELEDEIDAIKHEEKEERQLAQVEMQIRKGENMVRHEDEIKARPKRTWFETQADKKKAKQAGSAELNGLRDALKKKGGGKLSGKDKKKLDARAARKEDLEGGGRMWKKGAAERAGKGAVLNFAKDKAKAKGGKKGPGAKSMGKVGGKGRRR
ncbi:P-loop containing nucleoside triphosphate hydrolase protein [Xylaria curta]|nr:P-loop containing nucleoside triphosphate hydrolase protein [Xylaria curta]